MLNTFFFKDGDLYRWYVLNGTHVLDQGVAKTAKGAERKSWSSKAVLAWQLDGELG